MNLTAGYEVFSTEIINQCALGGTKRMDDESPRAAGQLPADLDMVATQEELAQELTRLRERSGLSARKVARLADVPSSTVHDWLRGGRLPTDDEQLRALIRVLRACGVSGPAEIKGWLEAVARVKRPAGRKPSGEAPYRGLASFEADDAHLFFGREEVAELLAALLSDSADFHDLPLVLVGPSGAGKSSVLRAGLLPRLPGTAVVFEPTHEPMAALRKSLIELETATAEGKRPAVVIDQFESLFTQPCDEDTRREFIASLCDLAASRQAHVAIALRADFYDHAIRYPELATALQHRQVVLGPMTAAQVSRAIIEPAREGRLNIEDGLVQLLLGDLAPHDGPWAPGAGAYEPGALPLLSHAMLATWENSSGGTLTIAAYLASGRIKEAVARTAEEAYTALSTAEQSLAARLFLRLVQVADDAPPTRATIPLAEVRGWDTGADVERVLDVFVGKRMITVDADSARITHDALLDAWPRLRAWISAGQAGLVTRRRISEAARAWNDAGRKDPWLWRGGQLELATEYASAPDGRGALPRLAAEFLGSASQAERSRQRSTRRHTRILQGLVAVLTALVVIVGVMAVYAQRQRQDAITARDNASSRQVALEAGQVRTQDPAVAAQLGVASYRIAHTPQAAAALLESTGTPSGARLTDTTAIAQWTAISPDHTLMAVAGADGTLNLWNVASPGRPVLVDHLVAANASDPLYVTAFSPDGQVLAAAGAARQVRLWNISDPAHPAPLPALTGPASTIYSVAFSPDGRMLAAGSADHDAWLWNVSDPSAPVTAGSPLAAASAAVNSVAFGLSGKVLAEGSVDGTVRLWSLAGRSPALAATLRGPAGSVSGVAFSHTNELAASSQDDKVWLWKVSRTPAKAARGKAAGHPAGVQAVPDGTLTDSKNWTNAVAFSPDGGLLAAGTSEGSVLVWTMATRTLAVRIPAPQPVTSVSWDGTQRVADSDADGTATTWTLPSPLLLAGNASAIVAYSPGGRTLAVGGSNVELWDTTGHQRLAAVATPGVNGLAFSPDGTLLAAALSNGTVQVMNAATLAPVGRPLVVTGSGYAESVAFSPDGKVLATGSDDGTMRLFAMTDPAHPTPLARVQDSGPPVYTVAFAPSGATLAAASTDDKTRLWNVADPAAPQLDGAPLGGLSSYAIGLAFTPDSRLLAVSSADKTVQLWNIADPAHAVQLGAQLTGPSGYVWAAAISPDGRLLAAGSTDGSVWLWNIASPASPTLIATLTGPAGHVYSVAFNPAGTQVTASSADGSVWTWDTSPTAARAQVCSDLGQPITAAQWATYAPGVPYRAPCS